MDDLFIDTTDVVAASKKEAAVTDIHQLILIHGRDTARQMVDPADRYLVDSAARVMEDEQQRLNLIYSGFSQTSLPLRTPKETVWRREGGAVTLLIESGLEEDGETPVGLPAGPKARIILIYLQTKAKQTNSRRVELGGSMAQWLGRMGVPTGGAAYNEVRRQARRISACKLTFFLHGQKDGQKTLHRHNGRFVQDEILMSATDERQMPLWTEEVFLDEAFFKSLMEHPVPLQEAAVRELASKPMALDIYLWLAWRLHVLEKPLDLSWPALYGQFGGGTSQLKHFKPEFAKNLAMALAVYPGAKVELGQEGAKLHPSYSPVEPRLIRAGSGVRPL